MKVVRPIRLDGVPALLVGHGILFLESGRGSIRVRGSATCPRPTARQRNTVAWVHIEVALRRDVRRMRTVETDGQEERFVASFEALQEPHRLGCGDPVGVLGVLSVVREPAQCGAEQARPERKDAVEDFPVASARIDGDVPRGIVVQARGPDIERNRTDESFPHCGEPAVRSKSGGIVTIRSFSRKWGTWVLTGWPARLRVRTAPVSTMTCRLPRLLRVGAVEFGPPRAACRCRRTNRRAVSAEVVVQIIGDQKEHVEARALVLVRSRRARQSEHRDRKPVSH